MKKFKVVFFKDKSGTYPVKDFILSLNVKMRAKVLGMLEILEEKGIQLREPYTKYLEDGIFELRCSIGSDLTRIMYCYEKNKIIVLLCGFIKKTQKTPRNELRKAKRYKESYMEEGNK